MITPELFRYVVAMLKRHTSLPTIETSLLSSGWSSHDVRDALNIASNKLSTLNRLRIISICFILATIVLFGALFTVQNSILFPLTAFVPTSQRILSSISSPAFYVAEDGEDTNPGTLAEPFATLTKARDAIRVLAQDGVTVYVRAGEYQVASTMEFTAADSGASGSPNVYRNYPGEYPTFTGSNSVTLPSGVSGDYVVDLAANGMAGKTIYTVYEDGERKTLARTPNEIVPNFSQPDPWQGAYAKVASDIATTGNRTLLKYENGSIIDPATWSSPTNARAYVSSGENTVTSLSPVASVTPGDRLITLGTNTYYDFAYAASGGGQRSFYYIENQPEFLDTEGEWIQDGDNLTYRVAGTTDGTEVLTFAHTGRLLRVNDASHIVFRNLSFDGVGSQTTYEGGYTTRIEDSDHVTFDGLSIKNAEGIGVQILGASEYVTVQNSYISDVKGAGIRVDTDTTGAAYFKPLEDTHIVVQNNYIGTIGFNMHQQNPGIYANSPGLLVQHNTIENTAGTGVHADVRHVNLEIAHNSIRNVMRQHRDGGGIYIIPFAQPGSQRSWLPRGANIHHNLVEETGGYGYNADAGTYVFNQWTWGIYLDDTMSSSLISQNVVRKAARDCFLIHSGRDNTIENNICSHTSTLAGAFALHEDPNSDAAPYGAQDPKWVEIQNLTGLGYDQAAWFTAFPDLEDVPEIQEPGLIMANNRIRKNIVVVGVGANPDMYTLRRLSASNVMEDNLFFYEDSAAFRTNGSISADCTGSAPSYNCPGYYRNFSQWQGLGYDATSQVSDPQFTDFSGGDYSLDPASPALDLGFVEFSVDDSGVESVVPLLSGLTTPNAQLTVGDILTAEWDDAAFGDYYTFRHRLMTGDNGEIDSVQITDSPTYARSTVSLNPGVYKVCVQAKRDMREPATEEESGWGVESCTSTVTLQAVSGESTPTPTPASTLTPDPEPTNSSTVASASPTNQARSRSRTTTTTSTPIPTTPSNATTSSSATPVEKPSSISQSTARPFVTAPPFTPSSASPAQKEPVGNQESIELFLLALALLSALGGTVSSAFWFSVAKALAV